ncbi:PAS domain S-box protein [Noviherbaspirillum galbum]|uniref:histidine kinase n=1 Tax=Noviherbaspirillum galbum TaxID=2709383 RepID=A0A6B3SND8_9BURK|nr:PAS domain S-box protein [Noviherbaspirillum galbum]NEX59932.1 PAS domain S-box protein [Noviherbaspirillum galbum]
METHLDFPSNSMVSALMREHDWSASVLGEPRTWPQSLRAGLQLMLNSKFPMFIAWGPQLGFLYNDGYAEILGHKHPSALGSRFQDIWEEIWPAINPVIESALHGEASYFEDLPLVVERAGYPEQAWFTFSYSPIHDDNGVIAGIYCSVIETSKSVRNRKLREFQLKLTESLYPLASPHEVVSTAVAMLAKHLAASSCWYAEVDAGAGAFHTSSGWFEPGTPALPDKGQVDDFSPALLQTLMTGSPFVCNDVRADPRTSAFAERYLALGIGSLLIVPVLKDGKLCLNINVAKTSAYLWTTDDIQAAKEVADRTWVTMENVATQHCLNVERDRSSHILNQMGEGFMLIGPDGCIANINAEGLRLLQRRASDVLGKRNAELWTDDLSSRVEAACTEAVRTTATVVIEFNFPLARSSDAWLEMRISSLTRDGLAVFFRDVTPQKRAALALRRSEEHLSALFEQTAAGIAERDGQGRLIRINERLCEILGRSRETVLGTDIHDLIHPDDLAPSDAAFQQLLRDGQPFDIEKRYLRPDGSPVWVSMTASLIRREDTDTADTVLAVVLDITERKATEKALQDETRILELLNQSGQSLAATLDLDTLLQAVTDAGRALTGAQFGAFFYNGKDESGDAYMLYTLSGAPKEAFESFGHPRATAVFKPTFHGEPAIRSDDITKDLRYGTMAPHHGMPKGHLPVRSYLAAPVLARSGEVIGGCFLAIQK